MEKLFWFDFKIIFRPGKHRGKPDTLSHQPDYTLGNDASEYTMTFLKPEQVNTFLLLTDDPTLTSYILAAVQPVNDPVTIMTITLNQN